MDWQYPDLFWIATLSDDSIFTPTEAYPDASIAWFKLKEYCDNASLKIIQLQLKFRTHKIALPFDNKGGYYFTKAASAFMGQSGGITSNEQFGFGCLEDDSKIHMIFYQIPELIRVRDDIHTMDMCSIEKLIIYG